ncbi:adenylate/guanylate cyclase domain-containing protein [Aeromicrobium sp. CF4.19]|uniref:adenylate/guanylate cyclase domain-containing protein n=1 Tax=Aeromicrobium sp. CF4.19 TaxID=3373082 RepID=UPI003EE7C832
MDTSDESAFDPSLLIDVAHEFLFDGQPTLTQREVAERAGVDLDVANDLWRYLGFSVVGDDNVAFSETDVEAIKVTQRLTELGIVSPETIPQFVRALGRSFSRLADWQTRLLLSSISESADEEGPPLEVISEVIPMVEEVQAYVWRRHLLAAASRIAMRTAADESSGPTVVGFVDIVGYTSRSRQMSARDLAELVEHFERVVTELVVDAAGVVVKTIGDEVLFTVDDPADAAEVALSMVEQGEDEDVLFPQVRVGLAHGPVLARLGDVFGPTVNLASRLTSVSRPGRMLIDHDLAMVLRELDEDGERWRLRRTRRTSVKGYEHLEPWSLKRPRERS